MEFYNFALVLVLVLAAFLSLSDGLAYNAPRATQLAEGQEFSGHGWTPAPTSAPKYPHEALRRGLSNLNRRHLGSTVLVAEDATCGYLSGSPGADFGCAPSSTCNLFLPDSGIGVAACCRGSSDCEAYLDCVDSRDFSSSLCDDVCMVNRFTLKCTGAVTPYCNTGVFSDVSVSFLYCASSSVFSTQLFATNYRGQTFGGKFSTQILEGETTIPTLTTPITSPSGPGPSPSSNAETNTSPSPSSTRTTATPTPVPNPTPVGAIVGGVIGGVALITLIAFGVFFFLRRDRANKNNSSNNNNINTNGPPLPTYSAREIDGYAVNKPTLQMSQQEQIVPSPQSQTVPAAEYYDQQHPAPMQKLGEYQQPVNRMSTTSSVSPEIGRDSHISSDGYSGSFPPNTYEMPGGPLSRPTP